MGSRSCRRWTNKAAEVREEIETVWPSLDMRMSEGRGGMGDTYLPGNGYWVCSEKNPWRELRFPFGTVRTALFGSTGAVNRFAGAKPVAKPTRKWGPVILVAVRLGEVGLLADRHEVVLVPWRDVPVADSDGLASLHRSETDRRLLEASAFD